MGSIQEAQEANKRTQDTNQAWMLNHTLQPLEVSAWPDDLRQALERGCCAPWSWMTSRTSPIKEKYVPYIRRLREAQNPWNREALLEEIRKGARGTSQCRRTWRVSCPCSSGRALAGGAPGLGAQDPPRA